MAFAAAAIYWLIVALWAAVLSSVVFFYIRNPKAFGTVRLLLVVVGVDAFRNLLKMSTSACISGASTDCFRHGLFVCWGNQLCCLCLS
jgi:hypothetical protein